MKTEKTIYFAPVIRDEEFMVEAGIAESTAYGTAGAAGAQINYESEDLEW